MFEETVVNNNKSVAMYTKGKGAIGRIEVWFGSFCFIVVSMVNKKKKKNSQHLRFNFSTFTFRFVSVSLIERQREKKRELSKLNSCHHCRKRDTPIVNFHSLHHIDAGARAWLLVARHARVVAVREGGARECAGGCGLDARVRVFEGGGVSSGVMVIGVEFRRVFPFQRVQVGLV